MPDLDPERVDQESVSVYAQWEYRHTLKSGDLAIITGIVIYILGLVITVAGRRQSRENWSDLENYQILPTQSLIIEGIYRYIRHPVYTGDFLLFVGLELALNSWLILGSLIVIPIMVRQALLEEALLARAFPRSSAKVTL
jgi:protein-S-isoprenylcysteine O-methyltransferase Ste14